MPTTINIPTTNTTPSPVAPSIPQTPVSTGFDPWDAGSQNDNWGWGNSAPQQNNTNQKKLTPQERVEMIEKLYEEVIGRKADTRDVNYYKYSTLGEEEIRKQLITGKEHKQLLEDGREFKKMKERAIQAETRVKMLESQIRDQVQEFQNLTNLLSEKNRHIQQLRDDLHNPYGFVSGNKPTQTQNDDFKSITIEGVPVEPKVTEVFAQPQGEKNPSVKSDKVGILDMIKSLLP